MNATELFHADGVSAETWYCGKCRTVHRSQGEAEQCCTPYKCKGCDKETPRYSYRCSDCQSADLIQQEKERFDKAEKVTEWDGQIFFEDNYYSDIEELEDGLGSSEMPEYVWTCTSRNFVNVDIDSILEWIDQDSYEGFDPDALDGVEELKTAIEAFNKLNDHIELYEPNFNKALILAKDKE